MSDTVTEMNQVMAEADCLVNEQQVHRAIETMAGEITERLHDRNPLLFCVMNGGLILTGQLLPQLKFPVQAEYLHATRYRQETTGGILEWKLRPEVDMKDRTVLIVDDILDEGTTLCAIADYCLTHGAREVLTAVLVDKQHERKARPDLKADFTGLEVEDRFLFGYGMDYKGYWRNAPGIYAVKGLDQGRGLNLPATRWYRSLPAAGLHRPEALGPARYWLQVPGSFTRALKQQCQLDFQVDVCREGFGRPSREEANTLNLANRQLAWIREVRLVGDGRPWVLARIVIPLDCLQGRGRALRHLGNKPLGAFLFSRRQWQRGELETGITLQPDHGQPRLARRSLFYRQHHRLMVCEYLLPELYR